MTLIIEGMTCDGCSAAVRGALESLGVKVVRVSWSEGVAEVEDLGEADEDAIREAIEGMGYRLVKIIKS
ncbi:MAG: cation transporter [Desulfurococcales archaeon]|nr:cation transporter [Desulfurococcales archaeon]